MYSVLRHKLTRLHSYLLFSSSTHGSKSLHENVYKFSWIWAQLPVEREVSNMYGAVEVNATDQSNHAAFKDRTENRRPSPGRKKKSLILCGAKQTCCACKQTVMWYVMVSFEKRFSNKSCLWVALDTTTVITERKAELRPPKWTRKWERNLILMRMRQIGNRAPILICQKSIFNQLQPLFALW